MRTSYFYASRGVIVTSRVRRAKHVAFMVGKPGVNRPVGRCRHRWEPNIKMYLKDVVWEGVEWINEV
jgi:hypothetical protein